MIKVVTNNREEVERYLDSNFSFENGFITVYIGWDLAKENGAQGVAFYEGPGLTEDFKKVIIEAKQELN